MKRPGIKLSNIVSAVAALLLMSSSLAPASLAQADSALAPALKSMSPQLDPNADKKPKPLQATIQHNEAAPNLQPQKKPMRAAVSGGGFMGRLRGGARNADQDPLRGRADSPQINPFAVQATSGYGIIGVKFVLTPGRPPIINRVFMGTPAAKVGLAPDDAIIAVDGVPTFGLTKEEVYDLIIGSPGTSVNVSIRRNGDFRVVSCTRMDINDITDPVVRRDYLMSM